MKNIEVNDKSSREVHLNVSNKTLVKAGASMLALAGVLAAGANKEPVGVEDVPRSQTAEQKAEAAEEVSSYIEALQEQGVAEVVYGEIPEGGGFLDATTSATAAFEQQGVQDYEFVPFAQGDIFEDDGSSRTHTGFQVALHLSGSTNPVLQPGEFPGGVAIDSAFAEVETENIRHLLEQ